MAFQVQETVTIARPVRDVQSFLADIQNEQKYWQGVKEVKLLSGAPGATGAKYERVFTAMGKERRTTIDVVESEPQRTIVQSAPGPVSVRATMDYNKVPEGTKVDLTMDVRTRGLFAKLMQGKIKQSIRTDTSASLLRLKQVLEAERKPGPIAAPARSNARTTPDTPRVAQAKRTTGKRSA
jgi:carbon monoxide dehydrogenase subunit G